MAVAVSAKICVFADGVDVTCARRMSVGVGTRSSCGSSLHGYGIGQPTLVVLSRSTVCAVWPAEHAIRRVKVGRVLQGRRHGNVYWTHTLEQ